MTEKYAYRIPMCADYDLEGIQNWLEKLAKKGLVLSPDGFFAGVGIFLKTAPENRRYRIEPIQKKRRIDDIPVSDEELEIYHQYGWEYVTKYKDYCIFSTDDPNAEELHTDPQVQAISIGILKKKQISSLFLCLWWLIIYPLMFMHTVCTVLMMTNFALALLITALIPTAWNIAALVHFAKMQRSLRMGVQPARSGVNIKTTFALRTFKNASFVVAVIIAFLFIFGYTGGGKAVGMEDYLLENTLPFAWFEDMDFENIRIDDSIIKSTVSRYSTVLAGDVCEARGHIVSDYDGGVEEVHFNILYIDARLPFMAKLSAREINTIMKHPSLWKTNKALDIPDFGLDYAAGYLDLHHEYVLQKGDKVVQVQIFCFTDESAAFDYDAIARKIAESL